MLVNKIVCDQCCKVIWAGNGMYKLPGGTITFEDLRSGVVCADGVVVARMPEHICSLGCLKSWFLGVIQHEKLREKE